MAHNTATSHVVRQRRLNQTFTGLAEIESAADTEPHVRPAHDRLDIERLLLLIQRLKPDDRQIMMLYLEGLESPEIGEITGISAGPVRIQIHRIKNLLARRFHRGAQQ